jgi:Flp pilus assembly pilin Flp
MELDTVPRSERGQALIEYAIIVALVGTCLVAILGLVGGAAKTAFHNTSTVVRQVSAPAGGGGGGGGVPAIPASSPAEPHHSRDSDEEHADPDSAGVGVHASR